MNVFFQTQSLRLLILCMDDQKFVGNLDYVLPLYYIVIFNPNTAGLFDGTFPWGMGGGGQFDTPPPPIFQEEFI